MPDYTGQELGLARGDAERIVQAFARARDGRVLRRQDETGCIWLDLDAAGIWPLRGFAYSEDFAFRRLLQGLLDELGCGLDALLVEIDLAGQDGGLDA